MVSACGFDAQLCANYMRPLSVLHGSCQWNVHAKKLVEMGGAQVALHVLGAFPLTWHALMLVNCCRKLFQEYLPLSCGGASKRSS